MIIQGDCLTVMPTLEAESVDAVVTDPPYGLEFMGKEWDRLSLVPDRGPGPRGRNPYGGWHGTARTSPLSMQAWHERWAAEAFRLAKPSAYLLAFGGTRTVHRMTCAIEDAGWIVRDMLVWAYASGFPKSKASLKPAWEPIVMARKPGPLRELAIDACRIGLSGAEGRTSRVGEPTADRRYSEDGGTDLAAKPGRRLISNRHGGPAVTAYADGLSGSFADGETTLGRWPANVVLTSPIFDGGWDGVVGGRETGPSAPASGPTWTGPSGSPSRSPFPGMGDREPAFYGDSGTYSRFFLIPKADRAEREPIWEAAQGPLLFGNDLAMQASAERGPSHVRIESAYSTICAKCGRQRVNVPGAACKCPDPEWVRKPQTARANVHPTVKPLELMRHLVRLVTPTDGLVLDPFLGSGTTGIAAEMEGFRWLGIEREPEYVRIAEARLHGTQKGLGLPA